MTPKTSKTLRFRFNVLAEFSGPPGGVIRASREAGAALGELINTTFQDRKRGIFLTVQEVKETKVLVKRGLNK